MQLYVFLIGVVMIYFSLKSTQKIAPWVCDTTEPPALKIMGPKRLSRYGKRRYCSAWNVPCAQVQNPRPDDFLKIDS